MFDPIREEAARHIDSSTIFEPYRLASWVRTEWERRLKKPDSKLSDLELVDKDFGKRGMFNWGKAMLNGEEVHIYQTDDTLRFVTFESWDVTEIEDFHPTWSFGALAKS
jgi:hypothetical protein